VKDRDEKKETKKKRKEEKEELTGMVAVWDYLKTFLIVSCMDSDGITALIYTSLFIANTTQNMIRNVFR
jgi:hypothetical protein